MALRRGMPDRTADERAAQQLASRLRTAAGEIRRLAYDLQLAASADGTRGGDAQSSRHLRRPDGPGRSSRGLCSRIAHGAVRQALIW